MLGRVATYVVPSLSVAMTALVLLGPGAQRPVFGVRIHGVPAGGGKLMALRLEGARRLFGTDDAAPMDGLRLEASSAEGPFASWEGSLGSDGMAEANLSSSRAARDWLDLRVSQGANVLAEGRVMLRGPAPVQRERGELVGSSSGDFEMHVTPVRGYLAAPFWDAVRIELVPKFEASTASITLEAEAPGAVVEPGRAEVRRDRDYGMVSLAVSPRAHTVELGLHAHDAAGHEGRWEGYLPIRPGALWIDPTRTDAVVIRAPSPRDRAYLSVEGSTGRIFGAIVPLADEGGFPSGSVSLGGIPGFTDAAAAEPLFAVVAGDPYEEGSGAIAWPLPAKSSGAAQDGWAGRPFGFRPGEGRFTQPPLELLVDGMPAAARVEAARAHRARTIGVAVIGAAALAEVLLLVAGTRAAQRRLEAHLGRAFADGDGAPVPDADRPTIVASARTGPMLQVAMFAALVLLAFALVAAASTFR